MSRFKGCVVLAFGALVRRHNARRSRRRPGVVRVGGGGRVCDRVGVVDESIVSGRDGGSYRRSVSMGRQSGVQFETGVVT